MLKEKFEEIVSWLGGCIRGSVWKGHVYIVGGAVRDYVLGSSIKDIDVVVDTPNGGLEFAQWMENNGKTSGGVVTYPTYGTAMFRLSDFPDIEMECVMTRGEQYHDKNSRKPETYFSTIEDDASRRDFTINSLYMDAMTSEVIDPTGKGLDDIKTNVIRVTNENADLVFFEDALRLLRAVRFSARLGYTIDPETYKAIKRNAYRLKTISKERIHDELVKILMLPSDGVVAGMEMLKETGLLMQFIPEFSDTFGMKQNVYHDYCTVWEHTMKVIGHAADIVIDDDDGSRKKTLMLGALLHDIGKVRTRSVRGGKMHFYNHEFESEKMAENILRRLKFSNETINEVKFIVRNHMRFKGIGDNTPKDKSIRKFQYECVTQERFKLAINLIHADNLSHGQNHCLQNQGPKIMERSRQLHDNGESMFGYKLPINGYDIMEFKGIEPGPDVKKYEEYLIKLAFNGVKDIDRESCFKYIKNIEPSKI